jgi:hypothetical protein
MTITTQLAAKGKVLRLLEDGSGVVFHPIETNYELHLAGNYTGPVGRHLYGVAHVKARKIYSVPSGGNFVQPVLGTPRIIQGRVLSLDERHLVVKAGGVFVVELPEGKDTLDLNSGDIRVGTLVNVVAQPGATFEAVS